MHKMFTFKSLYISRVFQAFSLWVCSFILTSVSPPLGGIFVCFCFADWCFVSLFRFCFSYFLEGSMCLNNFLKYDNPRTYKTYDTFPETGHYAQVNWLILSRVSRAEIHGERDVVFGSRATAFESTSALHSTVLSRVKPFSAPSEIQAVATILKNLADFCLLTQLK